MTGNALYRKICQARSLDAAVAKLSQPELADLAEYLTGLRPTGGIPAQVFGMVSARLGEGGEIQTKAEVGQ